MRVLVLLGGRSAEHEVSLVSAGFVRRVLEGAGHETVPVMIGTDGQWTLNGEGLTFHVTSSPWRIFRGGEEIPFDVVFPVLHGPLGEDGTLQGLCRMADWPFTGAGVMTSSVAMNKITTKELAVSGGIPVLPWKGFRKPVRPDDASLEELGFPLFVKPSRMGSSVGVSRVSDPQELEAAVREAYLYDDLIIVEKGMEPAREIEVALLSENGTVSSSVPGEIVPGKEWYDYRAKYHCPGSRLLIPAPVPESLSVKVREMAEESFRILGGEGFARADFLLDSRGSCFFNEINTIPGFTEISMFPKLWKATGVQPEELLERILSEALRRYRERGSNSVTVKI